MTFIGPMYIDPGPCPYAAPTMHMMGWDFIIGPPENPLALADGMNGGLFSNLLSKNTYYNLFSSLII